MITKFKIFEQIGKLQKYNLGDTVTINWKGKDTNVRIITTDGIHHQFSFANSNDGKLIHTRPIPYDENMIKYKTDEIETETPMNPSLNDEQPVATDYSPAARGRTGGQNNAMVLPTS